MSSNTSYFSKKLLFFACVVSVFAYTGMTAKLFVESERFTRILPTDKAIGNTLDEVRWSIGELILSSTIISNPGNYLLCHDLDAQIIIDSDDVFFNLNGYTVYDTSGNTPAFIINPNHKNIIIRNGSIKGIGKTSTASGIVIKDGAHLVQVENVRIYGWNIGLEFDGASQNKVKACNIRNCIFNSNNIGVYLDYAVKNNFENCKATHCRYTSFELLNSDLNLFEECYVLETTNGEFGKSAIGFLSKDGESNVFRECIVEGSKKTQSNFGDDAIGFLLKDGETKTKILDCIVNKILCYGKGTSYGIKLDFLLNQNPLNSPIIEEDICNNTIMTVAWSPESKFVAIGGKDDKVRIFTFDGSTFKQLTYVEPNGENVDALSWSPDGTYLAVGTTNDLGDDAELFVYYFDSSPIDSSWIDNPKSNKILKLLDSRNLGAAAHSVAWAPNGVYIAVGVDGNSDYEIQIWGFDGTDLSSVPLYDTTRLSDVKAVKYSPDGEYLATVYGDTLEIFSFHPAEGATITSVEAIMGYGGTLKDVDWSGTACGSTYYVAVTGARSSTKTTEVFSFVPTSTTTILTSLEAVDHGANTNEVKFASNGKYLLVCGVADGSGDELKIYSFDPSAVAGSRLVEVAAGDHIGGEVHSVDWAPSGRYIIVVGSNVSKDTSIFEVSTVPNRNIIENNEISDARVGLFGSSGDNLIIRNIGYYNFLNFSWGAFNTFIDGLNKNPTNIDNISLPPFYYVIFNPGSFDGNGGNGNGCNGDEECEEEQDDDD